MNSLDRQAAIERGPEHTGAAPAIDTTGLDSLVARALFVADALVAQGVREAKGRNRGPVVDDILIGVHRDRPSLLCLARYGGDPCRFCDNKPAPLPECLGAPWCARFARYCFERAATEIGFPPPFAEWPSDLASHVKWYETARRLGRLVDQPRPGDVGTIFGEGSHGHVVLYATPDPDAAFFWSREGNSGDMAAARRRPLASVTHWVRVA
jgi:hypothetical protein